MSSIEIYTTLEDFVKYFDSSAVWLEAPNSMIHGIDKIFLDTFNLKPILPDLEKWEGRLDENLD